MNIIILFAFIICFEYVWNVLLLGEWNEMKEEHKWIANFQVLKCFGVRNHFLPVWCGLFRFSWPVSKSPLVLDAIIWFNPVTETWESLDSIEGGFLIVSGVFKVVWMAPLLFWNVWSEMIDWIFHEILVLSLLAVVGLGSELTTGWLLATSFSTVLKTYLVLWSPSSSHSSVMDLGSEMLLLF